MKTLLFLLTAWLLLASYHRFTSVQDYKLEPTGIQYRSEEDMILEDYENMERDDHSTLIYNYNNGSEWSRENIRKHLQ